jgi:hypothetical protein
VATTRERDEQLKPEKRVRKTPRVSRNAAGGRGCRPSDVEAEMQVEEMVRDEEPRRNMSR